MSDATTGERFTVLEDAGRCSVRERGVTLDTALANIVANNSTDLSKKELFRILDRDGNGSLDLQEFDRLYEVPYVHRPSGRLWEKTRARKHR